MRVLHIDSENGWRGGENQLHLLVQGLQKRDVECHLAARPGSEALKRITQVAGTLALPLRGSLDFRSAKQIAKYCQDHAIDIIDAQTSLGHSIGLMAKWLGCNSRLVIHRRVDNPPGKGPLDGFKYKSKQVDHYIPISHAIHEIMRRYGIAADKMTTVRSATDPSPFHGIDRHQAKADLAKAFSLDPTQCFIGNASALSYQKGHETFIRAIGEMRAKGLAVHGFIAGDGELKRDLDQLRLELGLDHDVTFLGFVKEVPTFLSSLDILAVPSRNEGLGTIILDGIHAGCCICASRVGGIPEMIADQETGVLLPPDDVPAWTQQLAVLSQDVGMRERLAAAARTHVEKEFSVERMVNGNLNVYRRLLDRNHQ